MGVVVVSITRLMSHATCINYVYAPVAKGVAVRKQSVMSALCPRKSRVTSLDLWPARHKQENPQSFVIVPAIVHIFLLQLPRNFPSAGPVTFAAVASDIRSCHDCSGGPWFTAPPTWESPGINPFLQGSAWEPSGLTHIRLPLAICGTIQLNNALKIYPFLCVGVYVTAVSAASGYDLWGTFICMSLLK